MLRSYLPAVVFVVLGGGIGLAFTLLNTWVGARSARRPATADPYECGLPSEVRRSFRFGISFYLVAILFLIFDLEVLLLFPVALQLEAFGMHALGAVGLFIFFLTVAFVYEWRRGSLEWDPSDDVARGVRWTSTPGIGESASSSAGAAAFRSSPDTGGSASRRPATSL